MKKRVPIFMLDGERGRCVESVSGTVEIHCQLAAGSSPVSMDEWG